MRLRAIVALLATVLVWSLFAPAPAVSLIRTRATIDTVNGFLGQRPAEPGEVLGFYGGVTRSPGRVIILQRFSGRTWVVVGRVAGANSWRVSTTAPAPGRYSYRAVALATDTATSAVSATRFVTVIAPAITHTAAAAVEAGRLLTLTGSASPARLARKVQLRERWGNRWVALAEGAQFTTGTFTLRIRAGTIGRHIYRVVTETADKGFTVRSVHRTVTTTPASTPGFRATRLADVTPLGAQVGQSFQGPMYATGASTIMGRLYPSSVRTVSTHFSYALGAAASTFGTALALAPYNRNTTVAGPRVIEVRVDGVLRVRRLLVTVAQAVPVTLDVRGKSTVTISSTIIDGLGSDVLLATPVVTSEVRPERGVNTVSEPSRRGTVSSRPSSARERIGGLRPEAVTARVR